MSDTDNAAVAVVDPEAPRGPGEIAGYQGPTGEEKKPTDYFAFEQKDIVYLPDGVSWVEIAKLTEGDKGRYLNAVNRDVKIQRATGDASIQTAPGDERKILLQAAITNWNLTREGKPVPFSKGSKGATLELFLEKADPMVCDVIEKEIRMANPWLLTDMTEEQIDKEIDNLEDMKKRLKEQNEGKASSNDR